MSDDRQLQALEHVLANGQGDDAALRAFLDQACPDCADDLAAAEADLAVLALALPPAPPPAALRAQVLARIAAEATGARAPSAPAPAADAPARSSNAAVGDGAAARRPERPRPAPVRLVALAVAAVVLALGGSWVTAQVLAGQERARTDALLARLNHLDELAKQQRELSAMVVARDAQIAAFDQRIAQFTQLAAAQEAAVRDATALAQRLGNDLGERDARLAALARQVDELGRASAAATAEAQARTREAQVLLGKLTESDARAADLDRRQAELTRHLAAAAANQHHLAALTAILSSPKQTRHEVRAADGGRLVVTWDHSGSAWHVAAHGIRRPPPGRVCVLWFITKDGRKVAASVLPVDDQGVGEAIVPVPRDLPGITTAAVTDEPPGGVLAPTGQVLIAGPL